MLNCPRCHQGEGSVVREHQAGDPDDALSPTLPEGLQEMTTLHCSLCLHEWQVVTRKNILRSLACWPAGRTGTISF